MTSTSRLLEEFPEHTYEQWHAAAEELLKGAPFEKLLVSKTHEDITIQPIYRREDIANLEHRKHLPGAGAMVRGSKPHGFMRTGWETSQLLKANTPSELNSLIHEGLNGGQSELNIAVGCGQAECCSGGASIRTVDDMKVALDGVALDAVSTWWQCGPSAMAIAPLFIAAATQQGHAPKSLRGGFENDPLGNLVANGSLRQSLDQKFAQMAALTNYAVTHAPGLQTISVSGEIYHNAGATATQELGYVIATAVSYIEQMREFGIQPQDVLPHIRIRLAVGSDYFMEIAKIRAARWLWSKVADAYGVVNPPVHIHASTSLWNKTTYDPHTNMLRVTAEAFAAVVAGVDSLQIGTYDEAAGTSDAFSRRISRNLHTILREECGLDQVIDPAGGSYYIEWLTDQVAAKSWQAFQRIENEGGMAACLESGSVQQQVAVVREKRMSNIRQRREKIVGANMYPDLKGRKLEVRKVECTAREAAAAAPPPTDLGIAFSTTAGMMEAAVEAAMHGADKASLLFSLAGTQGNLPSVTPMTAHRAAEEYEALRDASNAFAAKTGNAPTILQLNIGPSRKYRLRADWTAAFFEAAGFAVDGANDFATIDDAVAALAGSQAKIAVITSDDATYLEVAGPLASAARKARPDVTIILAGTAGEHESAWRTAGIDDFVNVRSNNYEMNLALLQKVGVL